MSSTKVLVYMKNLYFFFLESLCCSVIRVTINESELKKHQGHAEGIYHKANDLVNGKHYWTSLDGKYAIWYDSTKFVNTNNNWIIGNSKKLGLSLAFIDFVTDGPCQPSSGRNFRYFNSDKDGFLDAPINSISIKCV